MVSLAHCVVCSFLKGGSSFLAFRRGATILFKLKSVVLFNSDKCLKARCDSGPVPLQLEHRSDGRTCYRILGDSLGSRE